MAGVERGLAFAGTLAYAFNARLGWLSVRQGDGKE